MRDLPLEHCCICDEPTGRAGRADDSLYVEIDDGKDEVGLLCIECYRELLTHEDEEDSNAS